MITPTTSGTTLLPRTRGKHSLLQRAADMLGVLQAECRVVAQPNGGQNIIEADVSLDLFVACCRLTPVRRALRDPHATEDSNTRERDFDQLCAERV